MQELSDDIVPSDGPPKKKQKNKSTNNQPQFQCICSWDDCDGIYSALKNKFPDDDPWTETLIIFNKRSQSHKQQCLKHSIFHHFGIKEKVSSQILNQSLFVVRRHHWPRELLCLSAKGNISDLIFRHTLKTIDSTEGYSRLLEECNTYDVIIKKLGKQLNKRIPDPKQKGKHLSIVDIKADVYVRAPVVDHCTARLEAFGTRLKNKHNIRPPVENDLPTTVSIVKIESISVTSPLDTTMEDDLLDNNSQPDNVLQEESTEVVLQLQPAYDQRDVRAILALATMRRNANAIIPSVEKLRETLVASFSSVHSPGWCLDQISRDALWLLQTRYETFEPIFIAPRIYLYPCDYREGGSKRNCLAYSIRAIAMNLSLPCDNCRDGKYGSQRRLSRHSSDDC